jgi:hypothetical protein
MSADRPLTMTAAMFVKAQPGGVRFIDQQPNVVTGELVGQQVRAMATDAGDRRTMAQSHNPSSRPATGPCASWSACAITSP